VTHSRVAPFVEAGPVFSIVRSPALKSLLAVLAWSGIVVIIATFFTKFQEANHADQKRFRWCN
jgi:hypothetical protein